ncbi:sensor histidine kinase [Clostridium sp. A1-XYC3]|uniref:histidine kinase n=1 Tax=Clostridium tanneri TaxID=3037988 RepID=A0ABU4JQI3_9CLOT|nr:sensor histidine kinase [Clostridium sp. A1-XYC3]MDW8800417.1 sensor histidine kinase [Clostridium sp. A1-XYC3]
MEKSIRAKILILIFITLIPLSILEFVKIQSNYRNRIEAELVASQDFAEAIRNSFLVFLNKTWTSQYAIGAAITSNPHWNEKDISSYLKKILQEDETNIGYSWLSPSGKVIATTNDQLKGKSILDSDYTDKISKGRDEIICNITPSYDNKKIILHVVRAIRVNNQLMGIVVTGLDINKLDKIFPSHRLAKESTFGIVDSNARIVYRSDGKNTPFSQRVVPEDSPSRKALKGEIIRTYSMYHGFDDLERMAIGYPIKEIGWSCFVSSSVPELLSKERALVKNNLIIFICIYIISFIIAIAFCNNFIKRIRKLRDSANEIIKGNLNVNVSGLEKDELGEVGEAFNTMAECLHKRAKEVEEYNNLKAQFFSTMSHELRTPLNIILGCIQLLEKLEPSNEIFNKLYYKYIKMQKQNSYRLLRLINNLIDINKAESNYIKIKLENNNIIKVIEDITLSVVEYTNLSNIDIIFDTEIEEKIMAFDSDMMERIMLNLLSNAIKFSPQGGIIEVNILDRKEKIIVSVKDSGIGIPEDKLQMIFDRYGQVDSSLSRKTEGSGIGLSLVKHLVELHEGKIYVKSQLEKGSQFIFELPVKLIDENGPIDNIKTLTRVERVPVEFSDIYTETS